MGFYTVVAAVYGAICYMFVRFFAFLLLIAPYTALRIGIFDNSKLARIWAKPGFVNLVRSNVDASANWAESLASFLVYLVLLVVIGALVSFIISFYFSANTIIYSLMRNRVDNTALEEIYTQTEESETEPASTESESEEAQPESKTEDD